MPDKKDPNTNPENMGGPSFHPDIGEKKSAPVEKANKESKNDGAILSEDQVPPL